MKTYTIKLFTTVVLLGMAIHTNAQEGSNVNREMTLEREYDPSVQDANKVNTLPEIKDPEIQKMPIDYVTLTFPTAPDKEVSILPSGNILTDIEYNKRGGYINFGGGTHMNINGDFGYHILSTSKDKLNLYFSHRSTNGNIKYLQNETKVKAKAYDNIGGVNYKHIFDKAIFKAGGKFGYSAFNYYGQPVISPISSVMIPYDIKTKQNAQTVQVYTGVEAKEEAAIGYLFDFDYTNFSYKYGIGKPADGPTEHAIGVKGGFSAEVSADHRFGVDAGVRYFNYNTPDEQTSSSGISRYESIFENYAEITASPYYRITGSNWNVRLGANLMYITGDDDKFMITPNVDINAEIAEKTEFYVSATGKVQSNSLYELSQINRYSNPSVATAPTQHWLNSVIGIKSGIAPGFWFDFFGGYNIMKNDVLFVPNSIYYENDFGNYSNTLAKTDINHFFVGAGLKFYYQKLLDFSLKGVYNNWDVSRDETEEALELEAFGRPKVEFSIGLTLRPVKNASLALDYYIATDRYALVENTKMKLDNINELNATATYAINDTFGAYVKLNNLLFQRYEWFYGYPLQKFNAMVGINVNF